MRFVSTRGQAPPAMFRQALFAGLAPDGGLYVPEAFDRIPFEDFEGATLIEIGTEIASRFVGDEIPRPELLRLLSAALDFPLPIVPVGDALALELFHGPTFAFKDVGARVMARLMTYLASADSSFTVLVATSGDTGSAVAQAFFGLEGSRVVVLFPERGVTPIQEAQFSTLGGNVTAVAVEGTFDDCQRLVKEGFADDDLRRRKRLTSANSINIGRLLPQVFYYAHAAVQQRRTPAVFSVPSGNFGNLTAGLWAWKMGAPIRGFVAATTINDTVPRYAASGRYEPRPSVPTLANAMDVGNPSNAERIRWLFNDDVDALRQVVTMCVKTDAEVQRAITDIFERHGYVAEPHTAIAHAGLASVPRVGEQKRIFLATAHPGKFRETIEPLIGQEIALPLPLEEALRRRRRVERIPARFEALCELLIGL